MKNKKSNDVFNSSITTLPDELLSSVYGGKGKPNDPTFTPTGNWASNAYYSLASMFPGWSLPLGSIDWSAVASAAAVQGNSSMIAGAAVGALAGSFAGGVGAGPGALGGRASGSIIQQMH